MMEKKFQLAQEIDLENEEIRKEKVNHTKENTKDINENNNHTREKDKNISANNHTKEKNDDINAKNEHTKGKDKTINAKDTGDKSDTKTEEEPDPFIDWPDWEEKSKGNESQTEKEKVQNEYCMYYLEGRCAFQNRCWRKHVSIAEYRKTIMQKL